MKYCQHCGTRIPDESVFCPSCGKMVSQDNGVCNNATASQNNGGSTFVSEYCQGNNYASTANSNNTESYSALTIIGFVFTFFSPLIGLILSICANNEAKRMGSEKNKSLSKAGIILSSVFIGLVALLVFLYFVIIIISISYGGIYFAV